MKEEMFMQNNMDIQAILSYVEEHLSEDISLDKLSEEFHYSKYYISRAFTQAFTLDSHQVYVCSPQEYRRNGIFIPKQKKIAMFGSRSRITCMMMRGGMAA